jgi:hypothetical protein
LDQPRKFSKQNIEFRENLKSVTSIINSIDRDGDKQGSIESKSQADSIRKSQNSQVLVEEAISQAFSEDCNSDSGSSRDEDKTLPIPQLGIVKIRKTTQRAPKYKTVMGPTDLGKHNRPAAPKKYSSPPTIGRHLNPPFENKIEVIRPMIIHLADPHEKSFDNRI